MFKTILAGIVLLAVVGGLAASEKLGFTSYTGDGFIVACSKSTDDISTWVRERAKRKGKRGHFSDAVAMRYVFSEICKCGRGGFKEKISKEQMSVAGQWFGLAVKARFSKIADKNQKRQAVKDLSDFLAAQKTGSPDSVNWFKTSREVAKICKL